MLYSDSVSVIKNCVSENSLPENWEAMGKSKFKRVNLDDNSEEYKKVVRLLSANSTGVFVIKYVRLFTGLFYMICVVY